MTLALPRHLTITELEAALDTIRQSPTDNGVLELIVRRPAIGAREVLDEGDVDPVAGLVGDSWSTRGSRRSVDGGPHPEMQLNLMNARVVALVAQEKERWPLAGDQLFVDLDLSAANLPAGTRLQIGTAVIEVTAEPHTGCGKFLERFGVDAVTFVNSIERKDLHLRGINAKVVQRGTIRVGERLTKIAAFEPRRP
jgi:MOSC domain-containing protein YiiM